MGTVLTLTFAVVMGLAALWDVATRRIPNALTLGGLGIALVLRAGLGWGALGAGALGLGVGILVGLPLFAIGGLGGGDAKLLFAAGAFMGPAKFLPSLLAVAFVGGALALLVILQRGLLLPALASSGRVLGNLLSFGRRGERITLEDAPARLTIPYGVAIAAGCLWGWFV